MEEGGDRWQPALVETLPLSVFPPWSRARGHRLLSTLWILPSYARVYFPQLLNYSSTTASLTQALTCWTVTVLHPKQRYQATWPKLSPSAWQIFLKSCNFCLVRELLP